MLGVRDDGTQRHLATTRERSDDGERDREGGLGRPHGGIGEERREVTAASGDEAEQGAERKRDGQIRREGEGMDAEPARPPAGETAEAQAVPLA